MSTPSDRFLRFALALLTLCFAVPLSAQWQKLAPPIESRQLPSDGTKVPFTFSLPNGMQYWVRTSGTVIMSTTNDIADAHYYNTTPTALGFAGYMVSTNGSAFTLMQVVSPQVYRADHIYTDVVGSAGGPLTFKLSDENPLKPQTNYYADNSGELKIEVAQWTAELIIQQETLDFGIVQIDEVKSMLDSIQGYGKDALNVTQVYIKPIVGGNVFSFTSERGTAFKLSETTNEFNVTLTSKTRGAALAELHIVTTNAFGAKDRVITLKADVAGPDVIMVGTNDTLDFGIVAAGGTVSRSRPFFNQGNVATSISSVNIISGTEFKAATPLQLPAGTQANLAYSFQPLTPGDYFDTADVFYASGGSKRMYLRGRAGVGIPSLSTHFIDFGRVVIGDDSIVAFELTNLGDVEYILESVTLDNGQFSFTGIDKNVKVGAKARLTYRARFAPTFHQVPYHEGRMVFKFDNGVEETVILRGRDDSPLSALLRIDTNYYARPGEEITITQRLIGELALTVAPIRKFTEFVQFDKDVLEFIRVEKADLIENNDWVLATSQIGGAIDIAVSAGTERLGGPGKLFHFIFRVRDNAPEGTVTAVTQVTPNFYNAIEPLAEVSDGLVHILHRCDPIVIAGTDTSSSIAQNQPNPFNPTTEIPFFLGKEGQVRIELLNSLGAQIGVLLDEWRPAGYGYIRFDGSSLASGVYTYVFTANGVREVKRMQLIK